MNRKHVIEYLLSLPRSACINFRLFGIRGLRHMPVLISCGTKIRGLKKGAVQIDAPLHLGMIRFGFGGSECVVGKRRSEIKFGGGVSLSRVPLISPQERCFGLRADMLFSATNSTATETAPFSAKKNFVLAGKY